ncbi:uncharacterized protein METZ01_LOCUS391737, partial [marine metagenome]
MFGWNNYLVRSAAGAALALAVVALGQAQEKRDPVKA